MNGHQLIKKLRNLGRNSGVTVRWVSRHGKGSHGRLYYGERFATIPDLKKDVRIGTLGAILKQLGLTPDELK